MLGNEHKINIYYSLNNLACLSLSDGCPTKGQLFDVGYKVARCRLLKTRVGSTKKYGDPNFWINDWSSDVNLESLIDYKRWEIRSI